MANIDYQKWLRPVIMPKQDIFTSKINPSKKKLFTVKMWNRIPQESLFNGNYTTCCTGIDKEHGNSYIQYMLNTAFNTVEVRTEKGKVIGMSRLFLANINNKPALIVENIEVNNRASKHYLFDDKRALPEEGTSVEQLGVCHVQSALCRTTLRLVERFGLPFQWLGFGF